MMHYVDDEHPGRHPQHDVAAHSRTVRALADGRIRSDRADSGLTPALDDFDRIAML